MSAALLLAGCTLHHSKQALATVPEELPSEQAYFVQEEDSGLSLLGLLVLAEPDHYAVLLARLKRSHPCARLTHAQLDFYTDNWLLIAFPISRVTAICEQGPASLDTESTDAARSTNAPPPSAAPPEAAAPARAQVPTSSSSASAPSVPSPAASASTAPEDSTPDSAETPPRAATPE